MVRFTAANLTLLAWAASLTPASGGVVINEVMYHPPNDRDELQWIELWNPDQEPADISGWSFTKGLTFTFPKGTTLAPGAFLVVCRDRVAFAASYGPGLPALGDFTGRLSHGGERIELDDAQGHAVDHLHYLDADPWPSSPDGLSASLERICLNAIGEPAGNWAPSPLPENRKPAGTPGRPNTNARANPPPTIGQVEFGSPTPGLPFPISATILDLDGIAEARLGYQVLTLANTFSGGRAKAPAEIELPMTANGDRFTASIPGQKEGSLIRFRIRASDKTGSERILPHPNDSRPTWSAYVGSNTNKALIPLVSVLQFGGPEQQGANLRNSFNARPGRARDRTPREPSRGNTALVFQSPDQSVPKVLDYIRVTPRSGGWKIRLQHDRPLEQMSTVNLLFEFQPRYLLSEHLAYEVYHAAGSAAPLSGHWRLTYDGRPLGYHLFIEQPNASFLRRNGRDDRGDLYKLLWYGQDIVGQHEKKNNPESGHAPIVAAIEALRKSTGAEQWKIIQQQFNVDSFIQYYAVNLCIQNWDGFFNNYFVYRSPGPDGKWEILPWDEDKTWGDYDGASPKYDWYGMPLTYGMNGDQPPRMTAGMLMGGIHGGPSWWRHPGWFSGPLLANPEFRTRFLRRLREIAEKVFTPEAMEPAIAAVERNLAPEVRYRANVVARNQPVEANDWTSPGEFPSSNADVASDQFRRHIESFRNQVRFRRQFILKELDKAGVRSTATP